MTNRFTESDVEEAALECFRALGYPPDKQETATNTVLQQAELLSDFWLEHPAKPAPAVRDAGKFSLWRALTRRVLTHPA